MYSNIERFIFKKETYYKSLIDVSKNISIQMELRIASLTKHEENLHQQEVLIVLLVRNHFTQYSVLSNRAFYIL